jgi:hypothetical protein
LTATRARARHRGQCSTVIQPTLGLMLSPQRGQFRNGAARRLAAGSSVLAIIDTYWLHEERVVVSSGMIRAGIRRVVDENRCYPSPGLSKAWFATVNVLADSRESTSRYG